MEPYQVYVRAKVLAFLGELGRQEQAVVWVYFEALGQDPFQIFDA